MHSSVCFVLILRPFLEIMSWPLLPMVSCIVLDSSSTNQRRSLMKFDVYEDSSRTRFEVPVTGLCKKKNIGQLTDDVRHERKYHPEDILKPFYIALLEGRPIRRISLSPQTPSDCIMDVSRTLLNPSRLSFRSHNMDFLVKLAIILFVHLLLKRNVPLELHLLSTAFFHWEISNAIQSPSSSYTFQPTRHWVTPSLSSSFHSTIESSNHHSRTFNATTIVASKPVPVPSTKYFQIEQAVTSTDLKKLQGTCDEHWIHEGNLCYRIVLETRKFNYAERFCVINSAHLVSISSQEENARIFDLLSNHIGKPGQYKIWLGMERIEADNKLHWVDGEPVTYENWAPGEPDSTGACVQMIHRGWWEDTSCTQKLPYICRKESNTGLPYSRATELGVLVGIPLACSAIMLSVVAILLVRSVHDSEGTYYGYGKHRNKDKIHSCLINMTASIAHVGAVGYVTDRRYTVSSMKTMSSTHSAETSANTSRVNSIVDPPEIMITPETPEHSRRHDARVFASSITSIEQDRFQSVTSLDNLLSRKCIKPKSRRMRSLRKAEAVISSAGTVGKYTKRDKQLGCSEA